MQHILITGGTGNIGSNLIPMLLRKNYHITVLTRKLKGKSPIKDVEYSYWDPSTHSYESEVFKRADHIIHLAGAGIADKRWTSRRKSILYNSRINSNKALLKALSETKNHIRSIICASGVNYYGHNNSSQVFSETDSQGTDFLSKICVDWESTIAKARDFGKRVVYFRTGAVLAPNAGAFQKFSLPLKFRIAAILGNGTQQISWIHIHDICRAYIHAIENESLTEAYNACSPEVVTNQQLMITIAKEKYGNHFLKIRIPGILLKTALGQMAEEALLGSIAASPQKLLSTGFTFEFASILKAVKNLES